MEEMNSDVSILLLFHLTKYTRESGGDVVGMSILPEACIAALYNMRILAIGFVTNDPNETHDHATNVARVKASAEHLADYLTRIIARI